MFVYYFIEAMRSAPEGAPDRKSANAFRESRRPRSPSRNRALHWAVAAFAVGACLTTAASAETVRMWSPEQAVTLQEGPLNVEARWVVLDDGAYEVTAIFTPRNPDAEPMQVMMRLGEGDQVTFGMPGYRTALYRFARDEASVWPMRVQTSSGVSASVRETVTLIASR